MGRVCWIVVLPRAWSLSLDRLSPLEVKGRVLEEWSAIRSRYVGRLGVAVVRTVARRQWKGSHAHIIIHPVNVKE